MIEFGDENVSGATQVSLEFDNGCGAGAVSFDALNLGLQLNWVDDATLAVAYPGDTKATRNASGEVLQCGTRRVKVVLTPA